MNKLLTTASLIAVLTIGALVLGLVSGGREISAQPAGKYEYACMVAAPRVDQYNKDFDGWSGDKAAKDYLKAHVFVFESGDSVHAERLNSLKLLNELAAQGWEVVDAQRGLLRRAR